MIIKINLIYTIHYLRIDRICSEHSESKNAPHDLHPENFLALPIRFLFSPRRAFV